MQETDLFTKTRRECVPTGSVAASLAAHGFGKPVCFLHKAIMLGVAE